MTELLQYASLLVLLEVKDPKVMITDNYQVFTVGIQMMSLDLLQEGLGKAIHRIWMAYRDIVQYNHERYHDMFYHLVDVYQLAHMDYQILLCRDILQVKYAKEYGTTYSICCSSQWAFPPRSLHFCEYK
jgi:hypothetical protein